MLHLHLILVGKTSFAEADAGIRRYLDRLSHYVPLDLRVIKAEKLEPGNAGSEETARERECERILKLTGKQDYLIAWDQRGREMDSIAFARFFGRLQSESVSNVWMVIGGPVGLSSRLVERADSVLSLSKMTFPHDLARLMVAEQLYRAFTILKGEPYHK
ncbi:MAG: 23S rRNA (pseudouridine(1915)-N(3))-methyltransferase RlmH [Syntrophobacteraceae bacterium]